MESLVTIIFDDKPKQWGLRGDPYFWNELKKRFEYIQLPYNKNNLIRDIYQMFKEESGQELGSNQLTFVAKYAKGGMSSGGLSHEFWVQIAIPLLVKRLEYYNYAIIEKASV